MIPKYLKIKGLYSYQEEAEINFERLEEAHIFGIFGRVGSGKSSILEAITFALYGEVSRMSSRDQRNYNLMNLKSNHLSIEFIFMSADDTYRILVEAERNKKNFEKVERYDFRHFKKEGDTWTPLNDFDPKEIIGLERSHFTKAVIIPQNKFQDFLMMADAERNAMMKTLFNLEKYDLMDKVKVLEAENSTQLLLTTQSFERVKGVSKTLIDEKNTEYLNLQNLIQEQQETLKKAQTYEAEMQQLRKQFEQLDVLKNDFENLEKQAPQYDAISIQIERYQYCRLNFQTLFEKRDSLLKKQIEIDSILNKNKAQLTENQSVLNYLNNDLDLLKQQLNTKEDLKNELSDLESILKIKALKAEILTKNEATQKGIQLFEEKKMLVDSFKNDKNRLEKERQNLRQQQPDFIELNAIKDWFSTLKSLQKDLQKSESEAAELTEKIEAIEKDKRARINIDLPRFEVHLKSETPISEVILTLKKTIENNHKLKKEKQKQLQHDHAMARVEDLAASLSEGKPCPLCGSIHHPSVLDSTDVKNAIIELEKDIERLENADKSLNNILIQLDTNSINSNKLLSDRKVKKAETVELFENIKKHQSQFVWQKYKSDNEKAILTAFNSATDIQKQLQAFEKQISDLNGKIDAETATLEKYQNRLSDLKTELATLSGQAQNEEKQIKILPINETILQDEMQLKQRQRTLAETIESIEKRFNETDAKQRALTEQVGILRGGVMEAEKNKAALDAELLNVKNEIEKQLESAAQFEDLASIEHILTLKIDIETEQKRVSEFKEKRYAADKAHSTLAIELKDKNYDKDNHNALVVENQKLGKDIDIQKENATRLEEAIKVLLGQLKEHEILKKELKIVESRAANIKTLKSLFTANGFVEYVSSMYLQNLCKAANERFQRLTQQQLRLEVTDKNDFQIRDMLNNGQTRSVRTLSGGQVFQAALSLAIALADSIQPLMRSKQNFFFLDEGFGALDKESLQIVFETLKSLRKENRIVGVISHVEDMQQEIERYLKVTFDVERGSMIELV